VSSIDHHVYISTSSSPERRDLGAADPKEGTGQHGEGQAVPRPGTSIEHEGRSHEDAAREDCETGLAVAQAALHKEEKGVCVCETKAVDQDSERPVRP